MPTKPRLFQSPYNGKSITVQGEHNDVLIGITDSKGDRRGIALTPDQGAGIALAVLESCYGVNTKEPNVLAAVQSLNLEIASLSLAHAQAKIKAEALRLANISMAQTAPNIRYHKFEELSILAQKKWLAVAEEARKIAQEISHLD